MFRLREPFKLITGTCHVSGGRHNKQRCLAANWTNMSLPTSAICSAAMLTTRSDECHQTAAAAVEVATGCGGWRRQQRGHTAACSGGGASAIQ